MAKDPQDDGRAHKAGGREPQDSVSNATIIQNNAALHQANKKMDEFGKVLDSILTTVNKSDIEREADREKARESVVTLTSMSAGLVTSVVAQNPRYIVVQSAETKLGIKMYQELDHAVENMTDANTCKIHEVKTLCAKLRATGGEPSCCSEG